MGIHERAIKAAASKFNNTAVYKIFNAALENKDIKLTQSVRRVLSKYVLEGTLNGLHLEGKNREQFLADIEYLGFRNKQYKAKYEVHIHIYINNNNAKYMNKTIC